MELFKLLGTISVENTEAVKALKETSTEGGKTESKLSNTFSKIGTAAANVGKVVATGIGVASTAIGTLSTIATKAYADYEQLIGGVETLFKDNSGKVIGNAENAYKTAGMSANEYMETVTSFSASLLQSLGGDTEKAAGYADRAIVDMSDNANKMGSSMESIQNAYQGFAKGNYTMLDNLKLGYGGTKEEMKRLIEDASKMTDVQEELGVSVDANSMSFSNIVDAISVVQKSMGIMGTTSKEASTTISGSISSMKAAWQNFLVGLADGSQNMDGLVSNLFESVKTVGANLIPRVQQTLKSIWNVVKTNAPKILAEIPTMVMKMLPQSVKDIMSEAHDYLCDTVVFGLEAVWGSVKNLASAFKPLVDAVKSFLSPLKDANEQQQMNVKIAYLLEAALYKVSDVINVVANVLKTVFTFIADNKKFVETMAIVIGSLAASFVLVTNAVKTFKNTMTVVKTAITGVKTAFALLTSPMGIAVVAIGALIAIGVLLYKNWDKIKAKATELKNNLKTTFTNIKDTITKIMTAIWSKITTVWDNIKTSVSTKLEAIKSTISKKMKSAKDTVATLFESIRSTISNKINSAKTTVSTVFENIKTTIKTKIDSAKDTIATVFERIKTTIKTKIDAVKTNVSTVFESIKTTIKAKVDSAKTTVSTVFESIKTTIKSKIDTAKTNVSTVFESIRSTMKTKIDAAKTAVKSAIDAIKGFFNFEFKWPKLSLPRFSITPKGWKLKDLLEGTVPKLGIEWYAKGGVLNEPTAFGINGNRLMVGGEAGPEAVAPIETLQKYISEAVAAQNASLVDVLQKILAAILSNNEEMKDKFMEALEEMRFDINNREFARLVKAVN